MRNVWRGGGADFRNPERPPASIFTRGLPSSRDLQLPPVAHVFFSVLSTGVVTDAEFTAEDDKAALSRCFHKGWLHTDKLDHIGRPNEFGYFFSSPLHRWYVEWKLWDTLPATPLEVVDILELIIGVIAKFSPSKLSTEQRIGPGCIQRPPRAQYQDEFYRCCHNYSGGSLLTFPEYETAKGQVDFYIPTKRLSALHEGLEGNQSKNFGQLGILNWKY